MDQVRLKSIVSVLEQDELTLRERQFVQAVKEHLNENRKVTDQQESILEGIYEEKIWIRKTFFSEDRAPKGSASKAA